MVHRFGDEEIAVKNVSGISFLYRLGSVDAIVLENSYQELRFAADPADPITTAHPVIVDVGAHIGAFAALAARARPTATIYALEPALTSFKILSANMERNSLGNVVPLRVALGAFDGNAPLHHAGDNWGHSLDPRVVAAGASFEMVPCLTMASFLDSQGLATVDAMKMNIEGGEYAVLLTTPNAVLRRVTRFNIEFHPASGHSGDEIVKRLRGCGFDVDIKWSPHEAGKGWVRAELRD